MNTMYGTKTAENLLKAFAGESQARNRYTFYASVADKEGYKQIRDIFLETADNEREHAKRFYTLLLDGLSQELPTSIDIQAAYPVAQGTTWDNLLAAANGEMEEWSGLYPDFAQVADLEGFPRTATVFRMIAMVEKQHEARYRKFAQDIETSSVFKKEVKTLWKCGNCGYVHEGEEAPGECPACAHPQGHFQVELNRY